MKRSFYAHGHPLQSLHTCGTVTGLKQKGANQLKYYFLLIHLIDICALHVLHLWSSTVSPSKQVVNLPATSQSIM